MEVETLQSVLVGEAMDQKVLTVSEETTIRDLAHLIQVTEHLGFPILNAQGSLTGIITHHDLCSAMANNLYESSVKDIASPDIIVGYPNETLELALGRMIEHNINHLPIVDPDHKEHLVGLLTKDDILKAYYKKRVTEAMRVQLTVRNILPKRWKKEKE